MFLDKIINSIVMQADDCKYLIGDNEKVLNKMHMYKDDMKGNYTIDFIDYTWGQYSYKVIFENGNIYVFNISYVNGKFVLDGIYDIKTI